jgi:hypothetical protein
MKKVFITLLVLSVSLVSYVYFSTASKGDVTGGIHIVVVDENQDVVIDDYIDFHDEVSLFDVLHEQYDLVCADASYKADDLCETVMMDNHVILGINDVRTDFFSDFIAIYIDDEYAVYGADQIMVKDGSTYRLQYTKLGD